MKKTLDKIANEIAKRKLQKEIDSISEDLNKDNYDILFKKIIDLKLKQQRLNYLVKGLTI